ncbi:aldehyde dehydrogenase (NADP(+)) [Terriglobus sp. ADX1]|uniref:aldehyde dehydrogenase (NADP(+)) n=1 Tax=Terriglobus sp. ADX1 TaxID=2794063 RepID=UPI002FE65564
MAITGSILIGGEEVKGLQGTQRAVNPATNAEMEPVFGGGTLEDVDRACMLAAQNFDAFRNAPLETRARLLEAIADNLMALGDELIERAMAESGLPRPRLEGERGRTCGQLRLFASLVREGRFLNVTVDTALPDRKPLPRSDLRSRKIPVGPVAVFGASNFPLAFSVAGGDTAAALAAGCSVIAKSHPSHLGTSELAGRAIQAAVAGLELPAGVFSLLVGVGNEVGAALVQHPAVQSVAFTGSRKGGQALMALAAARPQPVPVFAEMSSINPLFLLPAALEKRGAAIAAGLVASATLGVGQFCTKPGLIFGIAGPAFDALKVAATEAISAAASATMLNSGIQKAFKHGVEALGTADGVKKLGEGAEATHPTAAQPALFATTAAEFSSNPKLSEEVFGPAALVIECSSADEMVKLANQFEGQLTATMHLETADHALAAQLLPVLERKAGRIVINGFPTGVEVSYAMVHGGPFPSTSDARATSVGAMSIERFLRPVCYQDFPAELLPVELQDDHLSKHARLVDGKLYTA